MQLKLLADVYCSLNGHMLNYKQSNKSDFQVEPNSLSHSHALIASKNKVIIIIPNPVY